MKVGTEYYFYQNDHLGTPQKMTAVNGAVVWSAKYSSFGKAEIDPTSTVTNNLRFAGQYYDEETGLHYNWHRYLSTKSGRYLCPDLLGLEGDIALYLYAENKPTRFVDPLGLAIWICNRKAEGIIGMVGGNHAYLWDDRNNSSCGMRSSSGSDGNSSPNDIGPSTIKVNCKKVPGSDGLEDKIMKCCRDTANKGLWFSYLNDCHEAADDCIKEQKLKNPKAPGERFGKPCDPCSKVKP